MPRRTIRSSRPSSSSISRTRTRSASRTAWRRRDAQSITRTARHITTGRTLLDAALGQARRMLETYRVRLWAQQLGSAQTVGDARIRKDAESVAGPTRRPVLRSGRGRGRRSRGVRRSR
ncbi:DUF3418 domain-containing protein [Kitasatospora nipponensis]|uniref:DUF3418 domain-containing protein n=1 Tax=Kitasatospora nipponensis TaxID=258049 RepID=UPI003CD06E6C